MKVHALGSVSLKSAAQVADMIAVINDEASLAPLIVVLSPLPGVADLLTAVARGTAAGDNGYETRLREIEKVHFDVVRRTIDVKRQSQVIASVRHEFNRLEDLLDGIAMIRELSARTLDMVLAYGEWLSACVFYEGLRELRSDVRFLDTRQVLVTDEQFNQAKVRLPESKPGIVKLFESNRLTTVATGSLGSTAGGDSTTFGKGGNKYVASVLAAALSAEEVVVWTDTDGIMTADPKRFRPRIRFCA
jgi:bifunctional aspartokinase / homoserine dehydrogenase 1